MDRYFFLLFFLACLTTSPFVAAENDSNQTQPPQLFFMPKDRATILSSNHEEIRIEWVHGLPPFTLEIFRLSDDDAFIETTGLTDYEPIQCSNKIDKNHITVKYHLYSIKLSKLKWMPGDYSIYLSDHLGNVAYRLLTKIDPVAVDNTDEISPLTVMRALLEGNKIDELFEKRQFLGDLSVMPYPTRLLLRKVQCSSILGSLR